MKLHTRTSSSTSTRPAPRTTRTTRKVTGTSAFSMIEIMAVMTLITVIAGFSVPAVKGLSGANVVDAAAAKLSGLLTLARNEAIAQHTVVRFVVAAGQPDEQQEINLRKVSFWAWRGDVSRFVQLSKWEELPVGMIIEPTLPNYIRAAQYAADDAATVRGSCVLDEEFAGEAVFSTDANEEAGRFIEFLPSGSARIPGSERRAIFVATQGFANANQTITYTSQSHGVPTNWAQVNVDTLTGRTHIYRP